MCIRVSAYPPTPLKACMHALFAWETATVNGPFIIVPRLPIHTCTCTCNYNCLLAQIITTLSIIASLATAMGSACSKFTRAFLPATLGVLTDSKVREGGREGGRERASERATEGGRVEEEDREGGGKGREMDIQFYTHVHVGIGKSSSCSHVVFVFDEVLQKKVHYTCYIAILHTMYMHTCSWPQSTCTCTYVHVLVYLHVYTISSLQ